MSQRGRAVERGFEKLGAVMLCSAGLSSCEPEPVAFEDLTVEDVIETLFLGTGPANAEGGCMEDPGGPHIEGVWRTFAPGSEIELLVASSVDSIGKAALEREMAVINGLVAGYFTVTLRDSPLTDPAPEPGQITSADHPSEVVREICDGNRQGCAIPTRVEGSAYLSVRTVQGHQFPGTAHVHEVGHALGLCHINGKSLGNAVMANPQHGSSDSYVELEREAIRRVFASGLLPGAGHAEFREAGLIR